MKINDIVMSIISYDTVIDDKKPFFAHGINKETAIDFDPYFYNTIIKTPLYNYPGYCGVGTTNGYNGYGNLKKHNKKHSKYYYDHKIIGTGVEHFGNKKTVYVYDDENSESNCSQPRDSIFFYLFLFFCFMIMIFLIFNLSNRSYHCKPIYI